MKWKVKKVSWVWWKSIIFIYHNGDGYVTIVILAQWHSIGLICHNCDDLLKYIFFKWDWESGWAWMAFISIFFLPLINFILLWFYIFVGHVKGHEAKCIATVTCDSLETVEKTWCEWKVVCSLRSEHTSVHIFDI